MSRKKCADIYENTTYSSFYSNNHSYVPNKMSNDDHPPASSPYIDIHSPTDISNHKSSYYDILRISHQKSQYSIQEQHTQSLSARKLSTNDKNNCSRSGMDMGNDVSESESNTESIIKHRQHQQGKRPKSSHEVSLNTSICPSGLSVESYTLSSTSSDEVAKRILFFSPSPDQDSNIKRNHRNISTYCKPTTLLSESRDSNKRKSERDQADLLSLRGKNSHTSPLCKEISSSFYGKSNLLLNSSIYNSSHSTLRPYLFDKTVIRPEKFSTEKKIPQTKDSQISDLALQPSSSSITIPSDFTTSSSLRRLTSRDNGINNMYSRKGMQASRIAYEQDRSDKSSSPSIRTYYSEQISKSGYDHTNCEDGLVRVNYNILPHKASPMFVDKYSKRESGQNRDKSVRNTFGDISNIVDRKNICNVQSGDIRIKDNVNPNFKDNLYPTTAFRCESLHRKSGYDHHDPSYFNEPHNRIRTHVSPQSAPKKSSVVRYCTPIMTSHKRRCNISGPPLSQEHNNCSEATINRMFRQSPPSVTTSKHDKYEGHFPTYPTYPYIYGGKLSPSRFSDNDSPKNHSRVEISPLSYATPVLGRNDESSASIIPQHQHSAATYPTAFSNDKENGNYSHFHPYHNTTTCIPRHLPFHPTSVGYYSPYEHERRNIRSSIYPFPLSIGSEIKNMNTNSNLVQNRKNRQDGRSCDQSKMKFVNSQSLAMERSLIGTTSKPPRRKKMYSDFVGVTYNKTHAKYQACITHYRKQHYLGRYKLAVDAARAYDESAKLLKGNGWKINFTTIEEYERAKKKEIEETNQKRYDAGLPPASLDSLDLLTPKICVPLSVQETVAAESVAPYCTDTKSPYERVEEKYTSKKKGNIKLENVDINKKVLLSYSSNINDCQIEKKTMKEEKIQINAFKSSCNNFNSKISPLELVSRKTGMALTSAVTPSPHPQSFGMKENPRTSLQEEIIGKYKKKQDIDSRVPVVCNVMFNSPPRNSEDDILVPIPNE